METINISERPFVDNVVVIVGSERKQREFGCMKHVSRRGRTEKLNKKVKGYTIESFTIPGMVIYEKESQQEEI